MGAVNELPRGADARRSWDELEAAYREECAAMLSDARRHFEQRAAREQTTIENVLATFARDFDAWLDRERRGVSSPKPNLATLFEIWLERGARRFDAPASVASDADSLQDAAEARALALQQRLDDEARRIQELERRLADAERRAESPTPEATAPVVVATPALAPVTTPARPARRAAKYLLATIAFVAALVGATQWARHSEATPPELRAALARLDDSAAEIEARGRQTLGRLAADHARDESLEALLAADKGAVIARAIDADPQAARKRIDALAPPPAAPAPAAPAPALETSASEPPPPPVAALPDASAHAEPATAEDAERLPPANIGPQRPATFRSFDNREIGGSALATLRKLDLPSCVAACRGRENCRGYSFDKWNHVCRLKAGAGAFKLNPRMTAGVRGDMRVPRQPSGALSMERYPSKAFPGAGYRTAPAQGPDGCESACRDDDSCVAFTFRLDESSCHMFKTTGEYFSNELADSGGKRQD